MSVSYVSKTIRRSVALPPLLVRDALSVADPDLKHNVNRLVTVALREFVENHKRKEFEGAMERMAKDPAIQKESSKITEEK